MRNWINTLNRLMDEATDGAGDAGAGDGATPTNTPTPDATANGEGDAAGDGTGDGTGDGGEGAGEGGGTPESYADFDLPEGMEINQEMLDAFTPAFREMNLTQEQAQGLVSLQAEQVKAQQQAQYDAFQQQNNEWAETAKNDSEYGGENFEQSVSLAQKAVEQFGTPELKQALDDTGMGNHPEIIRLMTRIGKTLGEDSPANGQNTQGEKDRASLLYPS